MYKLWFHTAPGFGVMLPMRIHAVTVDGLLMKVIPEKHKKWICVFRDSHTRSVFSPPSPRLRWALYPERTKVAVGLLTY
jgi:hypothetical protein